MSATSAGRRRKSRGGRDVPGLEDEIRLLREIIQRAAAMAEEDRAVMDLVRLWGAAGRAAGQLSGLLKTERALGALRDANAELDGRHGHRGAGEIEGNVPAEEESNLKNFRFRIFERRKRIAEF